MSVLSLPTILAASAGGPGRNWYMHDGGYMTGGMVGFGGFLHAFFWLLVVGAIVAAVVFALRNSGRRGDGGPSSLDRLDERYAKGEIDREDYLQRKKDILER